MKNVSAKGRRYIKRRLRVKNKIKTDDSSRKRLCLYRSNKSLYAQIIDDAEKVTLVGISTLSKEFSGKKGLCNIENAKLLGKMIADLAKEKGISRLFFDRNGYLYHGKVKAFADSVRENGIEL
ncbi:MAG: 50S ribosomal protein L18 [Spirochaetes bacterium]|jgi:large subunit ribosomal protein L18|nr:50S ribosomal protein L18 [Spirochaetota bacterium]